MSQILPNLYVGSLDDAFDEEFIKDIDVIVNVASELVLIPRINHEYKYFPLNDDDPRENILRVLGITDLKNPLKGINKGVNLVEYIRSAINNKKRVLVHCLEGRSRSVVVCILYLIKVHKLKMEDAISIVVNRNKNGTKNDIYPEYLNQVKYYVSNQLFRITK
jgi:hypothetical protein